MRRFVRASRLSMLVLAASAAAIVPGCAGSSTVQQSNLARAQQQQNALANQTKHLQGRLDNSDLTNRQLEASLAQYQQRNKMLQEQLSVVRDELRGITTQLTEVKEAKQSSDNKVQALTASMRRRGGVLITPNNSLLKTLPAFNIQGVHVRRDGDVIRVELPGNGLFESGSARLKSGAGSLIGTVAGELAAVYPEQIIGIEGHTDSDPIRKSKFKSNRDLSIQRAMAVLQFLVADARIPDSRFVVAGYGEYAPVAPNKGAQKGKNRRVEIVVKDRR